MNESHLRHRFPTGLGRALAAVLLVTSACVEPDPRPKDELVRQGSVYLNPETLEPYSGVVFTTFDGQPPRIEQRVSLRDGHYDGPFEWYFGNRELSVRENYRFGRKDGPYEWYFENGRLYEKGTYEDGVLEGPYEAYYEDGRLYERGQYSAGEFHGLREWYLDDRLIEVVTYVNGRIDGPYERYTVDGEPDLRGMLKNGQPCGTWLEGTASIAYAPCGYESD